jgi:hypothetical protein
MRVHEQVWQRAIEKVVVQGVTTELVEREVTSHNSVIRHYAIPSSRRNEFYAVLVEQEQAGTVSVFCLCKAGLNDRPCWHAAAALLAACYLRPAPTVESRARGRRALALLNDKDAA